MSYKKSFFYKFKSKISENSEFFTNKITHTHTHTHTHIKLNNNKKVTLKNSMNEMKKAIETISDRVDQMEERN